MNDWGWVRVRRWLWIWFVGWIFFHKKERSAEKKKQFYKEASSEALSVHD